MLLADTVADLHPERGLGALDADDVQFVPNTGWNIPAAAGARDTSGTAVSGLEFYGMAQTAPSINNWVNPVGYPGWTAYPLLGELTTAGIPNEWSGRMVARGVPQQYRQLGGDYAQMAELELHPPVQPAAHGTNRNGREQIPTTPTRF